MLLKGFSYSFYVQIISRWFILIRLSVSDYITFVILLGQQLF